jgi:hypothetical protein
MRSSWFSTSVPSTFVEFMFRDAKADKLLSANKQWWESLFISKSKKQFLKMGSQISDSFQVYMGHLTRMDHILGHKESPDDFKTVE